MRISHSCMALTLIAVMSLHAENGTQKKVSAAEFRRMLARLPPVQEVQGRFDAGENSVREQLPGLRARGDIIPALIETLNQLKPGTVANEAEMYRLTLILLIAPDARAQDLIQRLRKLHPTVLGRSGRYAYPFDQVVGAMKFRAAQNGDAACWETALRGRGRQEMLDVLADARWFGDASSTGCDPNQAYVLLKRECSEERCILDLMLPRLEKMNDNAQTSAVQSMTAMVWRGLRDSRIRPAVAAVVKAHPQSKYPDDIAQVAAKSLKQIDGYEAAKR